MLSKIGAGIMGRGSSSARKGVQIARMVSNSIGARGMASDAQRAEQIEDMGKRAGVEFYQFSFVDLFGVQRSKLVPATKVRGMAKDGAGFAGFAAHLDMTPADGDLLGIPDPASFTVLPWNRKVAWLACDMVLNGEELEQAPRNVLRKVERALVERQGAVLKTGVECEFFLLAQQPGAPHAAALADWQDTQAKSCYDAQALMRRYDLIAELMRYMEELGWGPYQADHEDGNGQFEINWDYATALETADRQVLFKYMARSVAERHGLRASFMPKPFTHITGSGCHAHISLHAPDDGANLCKGGPPEAHGLSATATGFLQGLLAHAPAIAALTNPTVNSYKRLHASTTSSGATWSPSRVCWGGNDRTVMVRVPDAPRMELRLADMAANPYLLPAAVAAAGLAGGEEAGLAALDKARGGEARELPKTLGEALRELEASKALRGELGDGFVEAYLKLRGEHWRQYSTTVTEWELQQYLDS